MIDKKTGIITLLARHLDHQNMIVFLKKYLRDISGFLSAVLTVRFNVVMAAI